MKGFLNIYFLATFVSLYSLPSLAIEFSEMETTMLTSPPLCPADRSTVTLVQFGDICPVAPRESVAAAECWKQLKYQNNIITKYNRWITKHCSRNRSASQQKFNQGNLPSYKIVMRWPQEKISSFLSKIYNTPDGENWWRNIQSNPQDYALFEAEREAFFSGELDKRMAAVEEVRVGLERNRQILKSKFPQEDVSVANNGSAAAFIGGLSAGFSRSRAQTTRSNQRSAPTVARSSGTSSSNRCNYSTGACSTI